MKNATTRKVPPDGGYGWVVALAMALNGFLFAPMIHCFGLIFKDTFEELGLSATQVSLILNLHAAFGMVMGLLDGVLLKVLGYRKLAFLAAVFYFSGITLTSQTKSFFCFVVFFGLVASVGLGMNKAAFSLAVNTYFKKNRSTAMSLALTVVGLGHVVVPLLANFLMKFYTSNGVLLIFGGLSAHFFVTAMLLQPVKWHLKEEAPVDNKNPRALKTQISYDSEVYHSHLDLNRRGTEPEKKSILSSITSFFDLDLLKDPVFVNILIGLGLAVFSEMNFLVLTPFILAEYELSNDQIATFLSTTGFTDIVFRPLAPYIASYLNKPPRFMFMSTIAALVVLRFVLLFARNYYALLGVAAGLGMARGVRRVFVGLIIPSHVNLEKLPSAAGMEMMSNGLSILAGGSILGVTRDVTGSYYACIIIMNFVTSLTLVLWTSESLIVKYLKKNEVKVCEKDEDHPLNRI